MQKSLHRDVRGLALGAWLFIGFVSIVNSIRAQESGGIVIDVRDFGAKGRSRIPIAPLNSAIVHSPCFVLKVTVSRSRRKEFSRPSRLVERRTASPKPSCFPRQGPT